MLEPIDERDVLTLTLPADASVEETPDSVTRLTLFGAFTVQWEKEAGRVVLSERCRPAARPQASRSGNAGEITPRSSHVRCDGR